MIRRFIALLGVVALFAALFLYAFWPGITERQNNLVTQHDPYKIPAEAAELHHNLTIIDLHADSLIWDRNVLRRDTRGHTDVPRLQQGNVAVQLYWTPTAFPPRGDAVEIWDKDPMLPLVATGGWPVQTWFSPLDRAGYVAIRTGKVAAKSWDQFQIIRSKAQLEALLEARRRFDLEGPAPELERHPVGPFGQHLADSQGKNPGRPVGTILGLEDAQALEGKTENIPKLYDVGYRIMALQSFTDNDLGGSLHGSSNAGLTDFGRAALDEMAKRGIMVDLAQSSPAVAIDVLNAATTAVMVSHTGINSECGSSANLPDEVLQRIAAAGGLIGIGFDRGAVCDLSPAGVAATLHHAVNLVGIDHVALGSNFDNRVETAFDASELEVIARELLASGLTVADIDKIMGENALAFLRAHLPDE